MIVEARGLEQLIAKLRQFRSLGWLQRGVRASILYVKGKAAIYPPSRHGPLPGGFKSDKQRKFFFAALREGKIEVPYQRGTSPGSERLSTKWRMEFGAFSAKAWNEASYAPLELDAERQAEYHRITGWKTVQQVARDEAEPVARIIAGEIERELSG